MSVAILKADDEVGYWEYSVLTDDGEWTLEFSRTEEAGEEHSDAPDMYRLHVRVTHEGEEFFNSWNYGDNYPFMTNYNLNGLHAAAAVASLAYWYSVSAQWHDVRRAKQQIVELLGSAVESVAFLSDTGEELADAEPYLLTEEDCLRIGPHDKTTHRLYMELHHYGMATTTPEWRTQIFGQSDLEPSVWGQCNHDEHE